MKTNDERVLRCECGTVFVLTDGVPPTARINCCIDCGDSTADEASNEDEVA